jgi:hypothetical protein
MPPNHNQDEEREERIRALMERARKEQQRTGLTKGPAKPPKRAKKSKKRTNRQ